MRALCYDLTCKVYDSALMGEPQEGQSGEVACPWLPRGRGAGFEPSCHLGNDPECGRGPALSWLGVRVCEDGRDKTH